MFHEGTPVRISSLVVGIRQARVQARTNARVNVRVTKVIAGAPTGLVFVPSRGRLLLQSLLLCGGFMLIIPYFQSYEPKLRMGARGTLLPGYEAHL